jgi:hypothetical protein
MILEALKKNSLSGWIDFKQVFSFLQDTKIFRLKSFQTAAFLKWQVTIYFIESLTSFNQYFNYIIVVPEAQNSRVNACR